MKVHRILIGIVLINLLSGCQPRGEEIKYKTLTIFARDSVSQALANPFAENLDAYGYIDQTNKNILIESYPDSIQIRFILPYKLRTNLDMHLKIWSYIDRFKTKEGINKKVIPIVCDNHFSPLIRLKLERSSNDKKVFTLPGVNQEELKCIEDLAIKTLAANGVKKCILRKGGLTNYAYLQLADSINYDDIYLNFKTIGSSISNKCLADKPFDIHLINQDYQTEKIIFHTK